MKLTDKATLKRIATLERDYRDVESCLAAMSALLLATVERVYTPIKAKRRRAGKKTTH